MKDSTHVSWHRNLHRRHSSSFASSIQSESMAHGRFHLYPEGEKNHLKASRANALDKSTSLTSLMYSNWTPSRHSALASVGPCSVFLTLGNSHICLTGTRSGIRCKWIFATHRKLMWLKLGPEIPLVWISPKYLGQKQIHKEHSQGSQNSEPEVVLWGSSYLPASTSKPKAKIPRTRSAINRIDTGASKWFSAHSPICSREERGLLWTRGLVEP